MPSRMKATGTKLAFVMGGGGMQCCWRAHEVDRRGGGILFQFPLLPNRTTQERMTNEELLRPMQF